MSTDEIDRTLPLAKRAYRVYGTSMRPTFTFFRRGLPGLSWLSFETREDSAIVAGIIANAVGADTVTITFAQDGGFGIRCIKPDRLTAAGWTYDEDSDEFAPRAVVTSPHVWPNWSAIQDHLSGGVGAVAHPNGSAFAAAVLAHADEHGQLSLLPAASTGLTLAYGMAAAIDDADREALQGTIHRHTEGLAQRAAS